MSTRQIGLYINMDKVREILRLSEDGLTRTAIARSCGVSRQTVRDYIRKASAAGLDYGSVCDLPESEVRARFGKKPTGRRIKDTTIDYQYLSRELTKKGVTLQVLWEEYLRDNLDGYSYSQFCNRYRAWEKHSKPSYRRTYKAGEVVFVDYSGQKVEIVDPETGEVSTAEIFVGTLGASNYTYCEATASQELSHWIGSHIRMFEYFCGVTEVVTPDNLKSGVTKADYYEPGINRTYQELAEHYGVAVIPARKNKPQDKAKVEGGVLISQRRILAKLRNQTFHSIADLNAAIKVLLEELNHREMKGYGCSRTELFEQTDKPALKPLPQDRFEIGFWKQAKVSIDYHIEIKRHYYSVPYKLIGKKVWARVSERTVQVFYDGKRITIHQRSNNPGRHTTLEEHMPPQHRFMQNWNPTRFLEWAGKIGSETKIQVNSILLSRKHPEQAYRACLGLLSLAKKYSPTRLENACEKANSFGVVSMKSIKNMLETGHDKIQAKKNTSDAYCRSHSNIRGDTEFH